VHKMLESFLGVMFGFRRSLQALDWIWNRRWS
jgi:hypothetical protein